MPVTDFFAGELATEFLKILIQTVRKSIVCKSSAEQLKSTIQSFITTVQEIKYSGVELPEARQFELDRVGEDMGRGIELCQKIINLSRWNAYKNLQYARKLDKIDKTVNRFIQGSMQLQMWADIHKSSFSSLGRFDQLDGSMKRLEQQITEITIGGGGLVQQAIHFQEEQWKLESGLGSHSVGVGLEVGKRKVREMLMARDDLAVVGICGIGGSGKTTLAREISKDDQVNAYFNNKILFLTVSQSPAIDDLKRSIWGFLMGNASPSSYDQIPTWFPQNGGTAPVRSLIVLDDVWRLKDLEQLVNLKGRGCKILAVSRSRFPTIVPVNFDVECLRDHEAMTLLCLHAFQQTSIPPAKDENLEKQAHNRGPI